MDMLSLSLQGIGRLHGRLWRRSIRHACEAAPSGILLLDPADTLARTMFITRKHIKGSNDRGAWPWRSWHDFT